MPQPSAADAPRRAPVPPHPGQRLTPGQALATDLLVPDALLEPLPDQPVTNSDDNGDIVVILGPDAVR